MLEWGIAHSTACGKFLSCVEFVQLAASEPFLDNVLQLPRFVSVQKVFVR